MSEKKEARGKNSSGDQPVLFNESIGRVYAVNADARRLMKEVSPEVKSL